MADQAETQEPTEPEVSPANPTEPEIPANEPEQEETEDKRLKTARAEAAARRVQLREAEKALAQAQAAGAAAAETARAELAKQLAEVLGLAKNESLTPEQLVERASAERDEAKALADTNAKALADLRQEMAVAREARKRGVDPDVLLDSRKFVTKLHKIDQDASDYAEQVGTLIAESAPAAPAAAAVPKVPASSGGAVVTSAKAPDLASMSVEEIGAYIKSHRS